MSPTLSENFSAVTHTWTWQGFPTAYQAQGTTGQPLVLVHGFGASAGHWRKNIPALATNHRVYAIDLIGFGRSAKPWPGSLQAGHQIEYTFETWGQQIADFCREVIGDPAFLIGNSIGAIAAMQAAVSDPAIARGLVLLNCSLRLLHERRRHENAWLKRVGTPVVQRLLGVRSIGHFFFKQLARPRTVRQLLCRAYARSEAVTDELVDLIMAPARDAGAVEVFIAFTRYSQGPLPEDLLAVLPCPALIIWGAADPWEPIALGRNLATFPAVDQFIALDGVGHCPQDEVPEQVNAILLDWIGKQVASQGS